MKPQFQHQVVTSFALWLDHVILSRGEAFQNIESTFYYQNDDRLDPDFVSFASPHKQWVTDSSVQGAEVISKINLNGKEIEKNKLGIRYDYNNGRVLLPRTIANASSAVDGRYSVKDFNVYITDQTEEELLIETKFDKNSRFDQDVFGGVKPYDQVVPAIFCSYEEGINSPFAFGGHDMTSSQIRCVVFAESSFQLDGIFSILKDFNTTTIANVGFNEHPLNEFGDLKYGVYDYADLSDRYYNNKNAQCIMHVDGVRVSKIKDRIAKQSHPGLYLGFIDFDIRAFRYPRAELVEPVASRPPNILMAPVAPFQLKIGPEFPRAPEQLTLETLEKPKNPFSLQLSPQGKPNEPEVLSLDSHLARNS